MVLPTQVFVIPRPKNARAFFGRVKNKTKNAWRFSAAWGIYGGTHTNQIESHNGRRVAWAQRKEVPLQSFLEGAHRPHGN